MNAKELPQYKVVMTALMPILYDLPGKLIAIDGRLGVGKTTLGRYLAWRFNISLVETDLFLIPNQGNWSICRVHSSTSLRAGLINLARQ